MERREGVSRVYCSLELVAFAVNTITSAQYLSVHTLQFRPGIKRTGAEPVLCYLSPEQGGRVIS